MGKRAPTRRRKGVIQGTYARTRGVGSSGGGDDDKVRATERTARFENDRPAEGSRTANFGDRVSGQKIIIDARERHEWITRFKWYVVFGTRREFPMRWGWRNESHFFKSGRVRCFRSTVHWGNATRADKRHPRRFVRRTDVDSSRLKPALKNVRTRKLKTRDGFCSSRQFFPISTTSLVVVKLHRRATDVLKSIVRAKKTICTLKNRHEYCLYERCRILRHTVLRLRKIGRMFQEAQYLSKRESTLKTIGLSK